ncbi:MAG: DUF3084 domain-containing protein [Negativicutes bacterium]|nr:DUF3084 domain-containing protein [Negativicutes bacterium]
MYGLVLIAVLAVMGGIIAYIGDKLGSKVGKQRWTLFGLRPKHTSILVTIVTGITIAAATLGIMASASSDVRTALFGMEALKAELSSLSQEVVARNVDLEASRAALEAKTTEYSTLTAKINETVANLSRVTSELTAVSAERDRTVAALETVQSEFTLARTDLDKARQDVRALQETKDQLDVRVAALNESKTQLQSDVDRLNDLTAKLSQGIQIVREGVVIYRVGEALSTAVIKGGQSETVTKHELAAMIRDTNQAILTRLNVDDKSLEVLWIAQADFDKAAALVAATPENIIVRISSQGNIIYGEPVIGRLDLFPNRLVYSSGDTVLSQSLDSGHSAQQAEETMLLFLRKVNSEAVSHGMLPDPLQGTVGAMSGAELFDTVSKIRHYGGKVELTAIAKTDTYTAGPLQVEVRVRTQL